MSGIKGKNENNKFSAGALHQITLMSMEVFAKYVPLQCLHLAHALILGTHPSKGITLLGSPNSHAPP
jgi:hypothetical protein